MKNNYIVFLFLTVLSVTSTFCLGGSALETTLTNSDTHSRCSIEHGNLTDHSINCSYQSLYIEANVGIKREVKYQIPIGNPPRQGWPVVLIFQGSFFPVEFLRQKSDPFGGFHEAMLIKQLLDSGYAIIAPRAAINLAWQTNLIANATPYQLTTDYQFLTRVLTGIRKGLFGPLNNQKKFATGISSGGYNTSRMAVSFSGEFNALAIQSASYATCLGPACLVPRSLPNNHPPTLFIHGALDLIVPVWTMTQYYNRLIKHGIHTEKWVNPYKGHAWFEESPEKIVEWFNRF
ncbi:extracellular medium-chain-length polyhydroxyalkanoate depolymerase [Zooshikella sp. RANM57]|uniref:extracellular medium-chain-length polyhydroxyalkanoate depolymerase n=1 Tax=Zooshikella sp. RANM57 TaxID=3425863 RepID=UPI003D6DD2B1